MNETMTRTTQECISPIHPTLTPARNKNAEFPQTTIQSTVKNSVIPKYSQMDYQTSKPVTTSRKQINKRRLIETTSQIIVIIFSQKTKQQNPLYEQSKPITNTKL